MMGVSGSRSETCANGGQRKGERERENERPREQVHGQERHLNNGCKKKMGKGQENDKSSSKSPHHRRISSQVAAETNAAKEDVGSVPCSRVWATV
jgi:hypothetical protein